MSTQLWSQDDIQSAPNLMNKVSSSSHNNAIGNLLIDGGCDTSLCGNGFIVESTTERTVSVQGFNNKMKIGHLPVVTAITAIDLVEETIILEINEAIYVKDNNTSLLSTFQAREYGVIINDIAKRHGGAQNIIADGVELPLELKNGLMMTSVRTPTDDEIRNCTRVVLTCDQPWEVQAYNKPVGATNLVRNNSIENIAVNQATRMASTHPLHTSEEETNLAELQAK